MHKSYNLLTHVERHDTGGYDNWCKSQRKRPFVVDNDLRLLAVLANSARCDSRVDVCHVRRFTRFLSYKEKL